MRGISNIRDSVFEVCPSMNFEFHSDYQRLLKNYESLMMEYSLSLGHNSKKQKNSLSHSNLENYSEIILYMEEKLAEMQKRVKFEMASNQQLYERRLGEAVVYWDSRRR